MRQLSLACLMTLCLTAASAHAYEKVVDEVIKGSCSPTPAIADMPFKPAEADMGRTNNLRRDTGLAVVAKGEPIYIIGQVVDENCIPVADATVEAWQANAFGKYHHPDDTSDKKRDENFIGSGTTRTDNLGKFKFLTVFPGQTTEFVAPRVHFNVMHADFQPVMTEMYFPEQIANETDVTLRENADRYNALLATTSFEAKDGTYKTERAAGDVVYYYTITLRGTNRFKKY